MPKYTEPKDTCGLMLRAVIEGELMLLGLPYAHAKNASDRIESRLQEGPSDWFSLSDGTTFTKTWVPEPPSVDRWQQFGGHIATDQDPMQRAAATIHDAHEERVKTNSGRVHEPQKSRDYRCILCGRWDVYFPTTEEEMKQVCDTCLNRRNREESIRKHEEWLYSFTQQARIFIS